MKAMILAAGLGTRMRPLTDHCPKPLLDVAGKPLIVRHIEKLAAIGVTDIVINTSYLGELIEQQLGGGESFGVSIHYSREQTPLETAGGILQALPLLGEAAFYLINGDMWLDGAYDVLPPQLPPHADARLLLTANPDHHPTGDFVLDGEQVRRKSEGETAYTFSGLSVMHPRLFSPFIARAGSALPLREVLWPAIDAGCIIGQYYGGYWLDVGTPERLRELSERLRNL